MAVKSDQMQFYAGLGKGMKEIGAREAGKVVAKEVKEQAGDAVLQHVAPVPSRATRATAHVARPGGAASAARVRSSPPASARETVPTSDA